MKIDTKVYQPYAIIKYKSGLRDSSIWHRVNTGKIRFIEPEEWDVEGTKRVKLYNVNDALAAGKKSPTK